jgi:hypothetical protein
MRRTAGSLGSSSFGSLRATEGRAISASLGPAESAFTARWAILRRSSAIARGEVAARTLSEGGSRCTLRRARPLAGERCRIGCRGLDQAGLVLLQTRVERGGICRRCGEGDGLLFFSNLGQRAFDIELLVAGEREGRELARGGEAVDHVAEARARGDGREKNLDLFRSG